MKRLTALGLCLLFAAACKDRPPPGTPDARVAPADPDTPGGWVLTPAMLDGYLRYQKTILVQAGVVKPAAWDGGLKAFVEASIEDKANFDERARKEAGLTPDDVEKIEVIVGAVAARRLSAKALGADKVAQLPAPNPDMTPEQAEALRATAEQMAKMRKVGDELREERAAYGNASVDLILKHEDELVKNWQAMMELPPGTTGAKK